MIRYNDAFEFYNDQLELDPRYVIKIEFGLGSADWLYISSHNDVQISGATHLPGVLIPNSAISQTIKPEHARSTIGELSFEVLDESNNFTNFIYNQFGSGRGLYNKKVELWVGYAGLDFEFFTLFQTQYIHSDQSDELSYYIKCRDVKNDLQRDIWDVKRTRLTAALVSDPTDPNFNVLEVEDTSEFLAVDHGASYSVDPNLKVGYLKIVLDDEVEYVRWEDGDKTATTFTNVQRGAFGSSVLDIPLPESEDDAVDVFEVVYLEIPGPKCAYALLTNSLWGQIGETIPEHWGLNIPAERIRASDFVGTANLDLFDPNDDTKGRRLRFLDLPKQNGMRFIQKQILQPLGMTFKIENTGELGLKRLSNVLSSSPYVSIINENNTFAARKLKRDPSVIRNLLLINWDYNQFLKDFRRTVALEDSDSIALADEIFSYEMKLYGLHPASGHSYDTIREIFEKIRDRFSGPALRIQIDVLFSLNNLEVGDIVLVDLPIKDPYSGGLLFRSFEIQGKKVNLATGTVTLELYGTPHKASPYTALTNGGDIPSAVYSQGTLITDAHPGTVSVNGSVYTVDSNTHLTGQEDLNNVAAIYRVPGDLFVPNGVDLSSDLNAQLRVDGDIIIDGRIYTVGGGGLGNVPTPTDDQLEGFDIGGQGGRIHGGTLAPFGWYAFESPYNSNTLKTDIKIGRVWPGKRDLSADPYRETDQADNAPLSITVNPDGSIDGLPSRLYGRGGTSGGPCTLFHAPGASIVLDPSRSIQGGNGGNGGAGLILICKQIAFGASGQIDVSGAAGSLPAANWGLYFPNVPAWPGSGQGGMPGTVYILQDGVGGASPILNPTNYIARQGASPLPAGSQLAPVPDGHFNSYLALDIGVSWVNPAMTYNYAVLLTQDRPNLYESHFIHQRIFTPLPVAEQTHTTEPPVNLTITEATNEPATEFGTRSTLNITVTAPADNNYSYSKIFIRKQTDAAFQEISPASPTSLFECAADGSTYIVRAQAVSKYNKVNSSYIEESVTVSAVSSPTSKTPLLGFLADGAEIHSEKVAGGYNIRAKLTWNSINDPYVTSIELQYKETGASEWLSLPNASPEDVEAMVSSLKTLGVYDFRGRTSKGGLAEYKGDWAYDLTREIAGLSTPPHAVDSGSHSIGAQGDGTRVIEWTYSNPALDLDGFGYFYKLTSENPNPTLQEMNELLYLPSGRGVFEKYRFEMNTLAPGEYTLAVVAFDTLGNASSPDFIIATLPDLRNAGSLLNIDFRAQGFPGTYTRCRRETNGNLVANDTATWADFNQAWSTYNDSNMGWTLNPEADFIYETNVIDLGAVADYRPIVTSSQQGSIAIEIRFSDDGVSFDPYVSVPQTSNRRYCQLRVAVADGTFAKLLALGIDFAAKTVEDYVNDVDTSALSAHPSGGREIQLNRTFAVIKEVTVSIQSANLGYDYRVYEKDAAAGTVRLICFDRNNSDSEVTPIIDVAVRGV